MRTLFALIIIFWCGYAFSDPDSTRSEQIDLPDGTKLVRVYSEDVFYEKVSGELAPIDTTLIGVKGAWVNDTNTASSEIRSDDASLRVEVDNGTSYVELVPMSFNGVAADSPDRSSAYRNTVLLQGLFGEGTKTSYVVRKGKIKEYMTFESGPKEILSLTWLYATDGSPIVDASGNIDWGNGLVSPSPTAWDANGNVECHYVIGNQSISVLVDATNAVYPLTVDPTVSTNDANFLASRSTGSGSGGSEEEEKLYLKITAPSLTGWTAISSATLKLTVADESTSSYGDLGISAFYCDTVSDFDNTASAATLNALSFGTTLGTAALSGAASTVHSLNVLGDSSKGLYNIYEAGTPSYLYFKLVWDNDDGTSSTARTNLTLGDYGGDASSPFVSWSTSPAPYVEIVYTAASASFGVIMAFE